MTNNKSTKRTLLSSVLALVLCFAMLLGSTFAWFTDEVTSSKNIIQSGKLEVKMEWAEGDEDPTAVTYQDASEGAIFNNTLWEPGYTEAKHIKISNIGNLALKYQMRILANGVVSELADVIDVYYYDEATQLTANNYKTGTKLGTLSEVLHNNIDGETNENAISNVISGALLPEGEEDTDSTDKVYVGEKTITLALHMQEDAGNEYQNLSIGTDFSIQLLATQYTYEEDSFGTNYDSGADFAPQETPVATVYALSKSKLEGITGGLTGMSLDIGYSFQPTETYDQAMASEAADWHADFYVYADATVPANSMSLAGYYNAFNGSTIDGQTLSPTSWIELTSSTAIEANTGIRLIADGMNGGKTNTGITVPYNMICSLGNDGTGFLCGATDLTGANAGTTLTVELRLYKTLPEGHEAHTLADGSTCNGNTANCETGEYVTVGTTTYTFESKADSNKPAYAVDNDALESAIESGASTVKLGAGEYTIPSTVAGKDITVVGSGENTVFDFTTNYGVSDANLTFENLKITGVNSNTMNGYGIQHTTGEVVYRNCTFENAVTSEFYGDVYYYDCTFVGTYYIATYAVDSATFVGCTFDRTDSRALLVYSHGNNPVNVVVKDCTFTADAKGYTSAPAWTAAIEVDTTNITSEGTTVTIENCTYDEYYNGIVRDKSAAGKENAVITVDGVVVDNTTIKDTGYTIN